MRLPGIKVKQEAYLSSANGKFLDLIDMVIMEYIWIRWEQRWNIATIVEDNKSYINVSTNSILNAYPCFGIKTKNGIRRHIKKIIDLGYLELNTSCKELSMSLYNVTEEFISIKTYEHNMNH